MNAPKIALQLLALLAAFGLGAVLFGGGTAPHEATGHAHEGAWTCSMHPQIRQDEPGDCPICGMALVPVESVGGGGPVDRVVLSERARTLAALRTTPVTRAAASAELTLLGRVEPAETARRAVTTWVAGRVDRLHVNATGEKVRAGAPLATLYSPEVYAAHQDLLSAKRQVQRLADRPEAPLGPANLALEAARERLALLGIPASELATLEQADAPTRALTIRTPFGGTVLERAVTEGQYVERGAVVARVADLSTVWVQLDAYERDLPLLQVGQPVTLSAEALPGETFEGRVTFIEPTLDPQRRTARVRVEAPNPDGRLRPGVFVEARVTAQASGDAPLTIPDTAPLFTGERALVYVEQAEGDSFAYRPRTVSLGPRLGDRYPVLAGLEEGERVVSRGAFAIDADLQIRGGPSLMTLPTEAPPGPIELTSAQRDALAPVLSAYLAVQQGLAADDLDAGHAAASRLTGVLPGVSLPPEGRPAWAAIVGPLREHARAVGESTSLDGARVAFEPLSAAVEDLLARFGNPLDAPVHVAFCPMADDNRGARWVQQGEEIDNVYFGAMMRTCGSIREVVPPDGYRAPSQL